MRFVSCEPLLNAVDLWEYLPRLDWVIVGGESGQGARRMQGDWAHDIVTQCRDAAVPVPVFVKQLGTVLGRETGSGSKGGNWTAWPDHLRYREFPLPDNLLLKTI